MRSDLQIVPLPSSPPVSGLLGANTVFFDPNFKTKEVRLTDGATSGSFATMQTGAAGSYCNSNTDDTLLAFQSTSGATFFFQFNPKTMQGEVLPVKVSGNGCFSRTKNNVYYVALPNKHVFGSVTGDGSSIYAIKFVKDSGVWTYESISLVCDFTKVLPAGLIVSWQSVLGVSQSDAMFSLAVSKGNQDTGYLSCLYSPKHGYRLINTATLAVTGDWPKNGIAKLANTKYENFMLHGVNQTPNPLYTLLSAVGNTTGAFIWNNQTLELTQVGLAGHHGVGFSHLFCSNTAGGNFTCAPYATPLVHTKVIPEVEGPPGMPDMQVPPQVMVGDEHCGFGKIGATDESLLWVTYGPPTPFPFTSCWMGELTGVDVFGKVTGKKGTVLRALQTFNSGRSPFYEITAAMCAPFQSGRFVAYCSDMDGADRSGTLGLTTGTQTGGLPRGDVFIADVQNPWSPQILN